MDGWKEEHEFLVLFNDRCDDEDIAAMKDELASAFEQMKATDSGTINAKSGTGDK